MSDLTDPRVRDRSSIFSRTLFPLSACVARLISRRDSAVTMGASLAGAVLTVASTFSSVSASEPTVLFEVTPQLTNSRNEGDLRSGPIVEVLQSDGQWIVGALTGLDEKHWSIVPTQPLGAAAVMIDRAAVVAFVVVRTDTSKVGTVPAPSLRSTALTPNETTDIASKRSLSLSTPLSLGIVTSTDGQRLPGTFRVVDGKPMWEHRWIGAVSLEIDRLASIQMLADRPAIRSPNEDTLVLLNGDRVSGYIERLGEEVELTPLEPTHEAATEATTEAPAPTTHKPAAASDPANSNRRIPMERVSTIGFASVPSAPRKGSDFWTVDGSIVAGRDLNFNPTIGWSFALATEWLARVRPTLTTDNSAADALAGIFERTDFVPLADCTALAPTIPDGSYRYSVVNAVRIEDRERFLLGCADVLLDGPIAVSFMLPRQVVDRGERAVFCGELVLAEPAPTDARVAVSIEVLGETPYEIILDATSRRAKFAIPAASTKRGLLTLRLDDGGNGSIGDRVVLERAAILLSPDAGSHRD